MLVCCNILSNDIKRGGTDPFICNWSLDCVSSEINGEPIAKPTIDYSMRFRYFVNAYIAGGIWFKAGFYRFLVQTHN